MLRNHLRSSEAGFIPAAQGAGFQCVDILPQRTTAAVCPKARVWVKKRQEGINPQLDVSSADTGIKHNSKALLLTWSNRDACRQVLAEHGAVQGRHGDCVSAGR